MTDSNSTEAVKAIGLPKNVVQAIANEIFGYAGSMNSLSEEMILKVTDHLLPYYPLTEGERGAAIVLREWLTARQVVQDGKRLLEGLNEAATSGVRAWAQLGDRAFDLNERERRYHEERHREERHQEMRPEYLYKELDHRLKQGDSRALVAAIEDIVERRARRAELGFSVPPPQINLSGEVAGAMQAHAKEVEDRLSKYVQPVAEAKQRLSEYIMRIVSLERIQRVKD
jgi:hypothetical protein